MTERYSIGLDYGTNSVRAVVVRCSDGLAISEAVVDYPSGHQGILLDPGDHNLARQNPADYLFGLEKTVTSALAEARRQAGFDAAQVDRHRRRHDRLEPDSGRCREPCRWR